MWWEKWCRTLVCAGRVVVVRSFQWNLDFMLKYFLVYIREVPLDAEPSWRKLCRNHRDCFPTAQPAIWDTSLAVPTLELQQRPVEAGFRLTALHNSRNPAGATLCLCRLSKPPLSGGSVAHAELLAAVAKLLSITAQLEQWLRYRHFLCL